MNGMTTGEVRALIDKTVEWDSGSGICPTRRGVVEQVMRKNVRIDGDWYWLPDLNRKNLRLSAIQLKKIGEDNGK